MTIQSPLTNAPTLFWLGVTYRTILSSAASNGAMSIVKSVSRPGSGPPRHIHHKEVLTPGGFEQFFVDMAEGKFRIPEDMESINESAARHHLSFTGPPLEVR